MGSESRALHYYRENIAEVLGGAESDFWQSTVLQLSVQESAVRQALIAVSEIFEAQARGNDSDFRNSTSPAMDSYRKALLATAKRIEEPEPEPVALATCILFLCLHCLQGDKAQAVRLLQSGSGIMQQVMRTLSNPHAFQNDPTAAVFLPVFERLLVLLRFFGVYVPKFRTSSRFELGDFEEVLSQPKTFEEARTTLHWLIAETADLLNEGRAYRRGLEGDENIVQTCLQRQGLQMSAYAIWNESFRRLDAETDPTISSQLRKLLRLSYSMTVIWLSTSLDQEETVHDQYTGQYEEVVELAGDLIGDTGKAPLVFTFEMGLIPPLYWTALKCRDVRIRTKALDLLKEAPVREGLWNREEAIRVAARVIALENMSSQIVGNGRIFENARIFDAMTKWTDEEGTHVEFLAKEDGSREIAYTWQECIPLWYVRNPQDLHHPIETLFTQRVFI